MRYWKARALRAEALNAKLLEALKSGVVTEVTITVPEVEKGNAHVHVRVETEGEKPWHLDPVWMGGRDSWKINWRTKQVPNK